MSFFDRLFGRKSAPAPDSQPSSQVPEAAGASHRDPRHQLLRVALRATLQQHGIPLAWMGVEVLPGGTQQGQPALHLRLLVMHMDPRLLTHGLALERSFREHLAKFDPAASRWLTGISWQFSVPADAALPPLPDAASWTAPPAPPQEQTAEPVPKGMTRAELDRLFDGPKAKSAPPPAPNYEATQRLSPQDQPDFVDTNPTQFEATQRLPKLP